MNVVQSWIRGDVDWQILSSRARVWAPCFAGALFGAGWCAAYLCSRPPFLPLETAYPADRTLIMIPSDRWWSWIDGFVYTKTVLHETVPFTYWLPGAVATLALIMLNLVPRNALSNAGDYYSSDEEAETKVKCWLFFSYVVAFAAVAGGVAVLVACVNKHHNLAIGIGASIQCGLILAASLLFWAFRSQEEQFGYTAY